MSQVAALYVTAHEAAHDASGSCARHYYLGLRDAFDALLRSSGEIDPETPTIAFARGILAELDDDARQAVLVSSARVITARRQATREEFLSVV